MGKIDELILQYCPDGVEYVKLGDVAEVGTGSSNGNEAEDEGVYPFFVRSQSIKRKNDYEYDEEAIIIPGEGGIGDIFHYIKGKYALHQRVYRIHFVVQSVNVKFAYHYMRSTFKQFIMMKAVSATVVSIRKPMIEGFEIPLPPLPVQEAIVNILDRFTVYAAELQAELQARQQQYNYYRDTLLSFEGREDVQWKKLGEMCIYAKERIGADLMNENNYVSVENLLPNQHGKEKASNVPKEGNCIKFEPNDVLIGNIRPYLHKIWYADCVGGTNGDVLCVRIKDDAKNVIIPRYLYCILSSHSFFKYDNSYSKGAKMPRGDKQKVMEYEFGIPSLSEQQRIVNILDRFDTLVNDLSQGLPAEIEARQQQYEYYRDKLLTFKRK